MSRTNRQNRDGEADYYPTSAWCVHRLLDEIGDALILFGNRWLEPAVGDGAIVRAVNDYLGDRSPRWSTMDIREDVDADFHGSFLVHRFDADAFCVSISNPPYNQAMAFVEAAMRCSEVVVMLLRLNWLASEHRAVFIREHEPRVYVLPNRPSFTGKGTDATEYAWMVWGLGAPTVRILGVTPQGERYVDGYTPPLFIGSGRQQPAQLCIDDWTKETDK